MVKKLLIFMALAMSVTSAAALASPANTASAACNTRFLTFPAWYNNLTKGNGCELKSPADFGGDAGDGLTAYISIIALNVLEIMLQLVVYICAGYIIWGGYLYLTSAGNSSAVSSGKTMILNALVGLVISLVAVFAVGFIAGRIGIG